MIAYVDSSVLLRRILGQRDALSEWKKIETGVVSALVEVECLRTLDRWRLNVGVSDEAIAARREAAYRLLEAMHVVEVNRAVLTRAAQPLPTTLGTLDAIHLASALLWKEHNAGEMVMATHDVALAVAARAAGLRTIGA
ncbi:MAG: PIN domain-containing protein [Casimicrobiaceae bacterium]